MSLLDLVRRRGSIRSYTNQPVSDDLVRQVLEAGRLAPSAANLQPWHFIVIRDEARRRALSQAYSKEWFWKAPVILVVCIEPGKAWTRHDGKSYGSVDGAIAMDHMTLCATEFGLGTCWVGAFQAAKVKEALGLPDGIEPLVMTPLGYPAAEPAPKNRKSFEEVVHLDGWRGGQQAN